MPFAENLGTGGGALDAQYGSSPTANTNAPLLLDPRTSGNFVYTPGTAGNYVAVPHSPSLNILGTEGTPFLSLAPGNLGQRAESPAAASLAITGDIEVVSRVSSTSWASSGAQIGFGNRDCGGTVGGWFMFTFNQFAYLNWVDTTGTSRQIGVFAAPMPAGSGTYWIRWRLDFDAGHPNGHLGQAWYHADQTTEPSPTSPGWVSMGTGNAGAASSGINPATTPLQIGHYPCGPALADNNGTYRVIVRNGIGGTTVFDADFTQQALGSRGFIESTGKLVSLVGNAAQIVDGTTYGTMPTTTVAGGWTVPDSAALDVSDLEITARLSLNDWTAATNQTIVSKYDNTGPQRSYIWYIATNGRPVMDYDIGGVLQPSIDAGAAYPFTDGQTYWVRVRRIAATGVWRFYWAPDSETEPTVWTNVGGDRAGTAGVLNNSTASTTIGAFSNAASGYVSQGRMYRAIIRNANTGGTKVLDADFTRQLQFASTFTEGSSQLATVTTVGAARIERDRDLDLRVKVALDDWTPSTNVALAAKMAAQKSYILMLLNTGGLYFGWSADGTNEIGAQSAPLGVTDGAAKWVRVTLDVNNGANGHTVSFFTSDDGTTWTPAPAVVTLPGATSIFPSTVAVEVATYGIGTLSPATGKFFNAEIRNGINGPAVLDIDFTDAITTGAETYLLDTPSEVIPGAEQYLPNLGYGGTVLNARFGSAVGADTNDPLLLTHTGTNYLYNAGGTGVISQNCVTLPDSVPLRITGDLDIAFRMSADSWTPSNNMCIGGKDETTVGRGYAVVLGVTGLLTLHWSPLGTDASVLIATSTVAVPFAAGAAGWVRATIDVDNGAGGRTITFYVANDSPTEPTSWSQLGDPRVQAGTTSIFATTQPVSFGFCRSGSLNWSGAMHRMIVKNGIGGTTVLDVNTAALTSGGATTFTATTGQTATIVRSTSGRKSVAVVQDVLLFGTDDYLEVPDNDLLDFGANASFTVMTAVRQWATQVASGRWLDKRGSSGAGYLLAPYSTAQTVYPFISDGANSAGNFATAPAFTYGAQLVASTVVDRTTQQIVSYSGTSPGGNASTAAVGSLATAQTLRIGMRSDGGGDIQDMEFRGSAVWRRALTPAEVALVNAHYTTGPTTASTALMQQAVWWIDAGTRSVAQINRSTSGRKSVACARCTWLLGTDDFFEVPASNLFDFAQGQDYTLLVLHRGWWEQGTNDTLLATSSSTTASAAGWAMSNSSGDPWQAGGRHGDGSNGVTAVAPRRDVGALTGTFLVRDTATDTLTAFTGSTSGTPVTDTTTGTIGNTNVMRLGRLSTTGAEYLDAEVVAAVVWRRKLTTAERNAVLAYYGV